MNIKKIGSDIWAKVKTVGLLLWSKGVAAIILVILMFKYIGLDSEKPTPFAELLYAGVLVASVIVIAPVVRLLVFAEASELAESGKLRSLLDGKDFTPMIIHYWVATIISYTVTLLCVSSLLS
jgi:hypothetical protein